MFKWLKYIIPTLFITGALWAGGVHYDGSDSGGGAASLFLDGTAAAPGLYPLSDSTSGFYYYGTNGIGVANAGVASWHWSGGGNYICDKAGAYLEVIGSGTGEAGRLYSYGFAGQPAGADVSMTNQNTIISGQSAYPLAATNTTGGDLRVMAGEGATTVTIPAVHTCTAGDTITLTLDGTNGTNIATGLYTYGTNWCLAACADSTAIAASLATVALGTTGVTSYQSGTMMGFTRALNAVTKARISAVASDGGCAVVVNGVDGSVVIRNNMTVNGLLLISDSGSAYLEIESDGTNDGAYVYPHGIVGKVREADEDPDRWYLMGQSAYPLATVNMTGRDMYIAGGEGTSKFTVVGPIGGTCNAGDYVTVLMNGTSTGSVTYGTHWCIGGCLTDEAAAISLAAYLDSLSGLDVVRSGQIIGLKRSLSNTSVMSISAGSTNDGGCIASITNGTDGVVYLGASGIQPIGSPNIGSTSNILGSVYAATYYSNSTALIACPDYAFCSGSSGSGLKYFANGVFGYPDSTSGSYINKAASTLHLRASSGNRYSTSNTTGASIDNTPGLGTRLLTVSDYTACAGDTVTVWVDGTTVTLTEGAGGAPTQWDRGASNAAAATSLEAAIEAVTGVTSVVNGTVAVSAWIAVADESTYHVMKLGGTALDSVCITDGSGTNGSLRQYGNMTFLPTNTYDIGAAAATKPRSIYAATHIESDGSVYAADWFRVTTTNTGLMNNTTGANTVVKPGTNTGTNEAGTVKIQTMPMFRAGTTAQTGQDRMVFKSGAKPVVEGADTSLVRITFPAATLAYGTVRMFYTIACSDGTDVKSDSGIYTLVAVQKADNTLYEDGAHTSAVGGIEVDIESGGGAAITDTDWEILEDEGNHQVTIVFGEGMDCNFVGANTWFEIHYSVMNEFGQNMTLELL